MTEKPDPESKSSGAPSTTRAYQGAMEAAFSIPIGGGLGWLADRQFGTEPILLGLGLAVGFAACVRRLMKMRQVVEEEAAAAVEAQRGEQPAGSRSERFGVGDFGAVDDDDDAY